MLWRKAFGALSRELPPAAVTAHVDRRSRCRYHSDATDVTVFGRSKEVAEAAHQNRQQVLHLARANKKPKVPVTLLREGRAIPWLVCGRFGHGRRAVRAGEKSGIATQFSLELDAYYCRR